LITSEALSVTVNIKNPPLNHLYLRFNGNLSIISGLSITFFSGRRNLSIIFILHSGFVSIDINRLSRILLLKIKK